MADRESKDGTSRDINRIVDSFEVMRIIRKVLIEHPDEYINKAFLCKEFGWGDREWKIAKDFLDLIAKRFHEFFKDAYEAYEAGRLIQGSSEGKYKSIVEMFIQKYKVPPVRYSGKKIVDNGTSYPPSYVVLTYKELRNRLNILGLKGARDFNTKLHHIKDKGMEVIWVEQEKELISEINRMLIGKVSENNKENSVKLLNNGKDDNIEKI